MVLIQELMQQIQELMQQIQELIRQQGKGEEYPQVLDKKVESKRFLLCNDAAIAILKAAKVQ